MAEHCRESVHTCSASVLRTKTASRTLDPAAILRPLVWFGLVGRPFGGYDLCDEKPLLTERNGTQQTRGNVRQRQFRQIRWKWAITNKAEIADDQSLR